MNESKQLPVSFLTNDPENQQLGRNLRTEHIPAPFNLLIIDRISSSSSFLSLNFIVKALKVDRPVIFLSFNLSYDHWFSLLQKQSIQLDSIRYNKIFKFIDGFKLNLHQDEDVERMRKTLSEMISDLVTQLAPLSKQSPLVLIDDLTTMVWSSHLSSKQWIHCFQSLFPSYYPLLFSLIMVFHDDLLSSNPRDRHVFNHLISRSDLILRTRALAGPGRGELIVERGANNLNDMELPITLSLDQTTQYKIVDNSVTYYPKGLDKGFI